LLTTPAFADVVSPKADAVAITIYRDTPASARQLREAGDDDRSGLAMVAETRTVVLPAGRSRISFAGVADDIIPASATLEGLPGGQVERDFDYDLLDPASLIEKSVGGQVMVRRTNPKTGEVTEEPATLLEGPAGVLVKTATGVEALGCGAGPQGLVFTHLPEGLAAQPALSVVADVPSAGRYTLTLNYLSVAIDWSADYVARLSPDGKTLDLTGWLTLSNRSGMSFADAPTAVVAGKLARVAPDLPDISPAETTPECWPMGTTTDGLTALQTRPPLGIPEPPPPSAPMMDMMNAASVSEMVVTAEHRRVTATTLGDYKLYTIDEPTTVAARQTKQIRFLHQTAVKFDTLYVWHVNSIANDQDAPVPADVTLSFENKEAVGLGLPLPAGMVSFRQPQAAAGGRELFIGEQGLRDVPLNEPFELQTGRAGDVTAVQRVVSDETRAGHERVTLEFTLTSAKSAPVIAELRQTPEGEGFKVVSESTSHVLKNGDDVWRVSIPANGSATVTTTIETAS
jgi:hypothetical protein